MFIEIVSEFVDEEKLDVMVNVNHIVEAYSCPGNDAHTMLVISRGEERHTIRVCEPYLQFKKRLLRNGL